MSKNTTFQLTGGMSPGRSAFDLSHEKKFTCDMGQLIPVLCMEVVPGDHITLGNQAVTRFQPTVAPIMHEISIFTHSFFVSYDNMWNGDGTDNWESFITKGVSGDLDISPPEWNPTPFTPYDPGPPIVPYAANGNGVGSLWDYLGLPTEVVPTDSLPLDFPRIAYNMIYNEYYRDQNLINEVSLDNEDILLRAWLKDYFSSSLPWQQRGTAPSFPVSGLTSAVWDSSKFDGTGLPGSQQSPYYNQVGTDPVAYFSNTGSSGNMEGMLNDNVVDLSSATTFTIADFRLALAIQQWQERNARGGVRMTEFLRQHFGVSPKDERLDRPEYIGGSRSSVISSEVLQTSSTDSTSPQGNLAGHAIGLSDSYCGKYAVKEFGLIMTIMSVMPRPAYQQGIQRAWLRKTPHEFFFPEFESLSEQAVLNAEIYASASGTDNNDIFGYQGRFDELRYLPNQVCGEMRELFDYWHLGRKFLSLPLLNQSFIECNPEDTKRIFAVQDEPGLIVQFANIIKAIRPLRKMAIPGV